MRGTDHIIVIRFPTLGITPAHAGNRVVFDEYHAYEKDHPRSCGEQPKLVKTGGE